MERVKIINYQHVGSFRKFGIDLVGSIPWGTHLCQFYESKQDLIDILVPYFAEGLRSNEFCIWVTSPPLEVEEARKALQEAVPDLDEYFKKGQIEIVSYNNWYLLGGKFDSNRVLQGWVEKEKAALKRGFEGLRLTGITLWIERELWNSFVDYEEAVNSVIGQHRILALCTYCLKNCSGTDVLDVVRNHAGTLIKQGGKWDLIEDAAQRRKADAEIARLASFPALNPNPVIEVDTDGNLQYANAAAIVTFPDLKEQRLLHPFFYDWKHILKTVRAEKEGTFGREQKIGDHWYYQQFSLVPKNQYLRVYTVKIDELKQVESKLRESEQRWATTISSIGDAVIATDVNGNVVFMNSVAEALTGWSLHEAQQKPLKEVFNIVNEFTREEVENPVARVIKEGLVVGLANHTILVRKDGTKVPIDDSGAPIKDKEGNITGVVLVFRNITERKKAEEALIESEKRLNRSQEIAHLGSWELDLITNKLSWSDEAYIIFGLKPQEFGATYEAFLEAVHPDDRAAVDAAYSGSLREGRDTYEIEHRVVRKSSGEIRVVQEKCEHIRDKSGRIIRSVGMVQDITEHKKAENELRETRDYLENLLNYANAPVIVWDPQFRITLFNHAFEHLTGLCANDVLEKRLEILFPEDKKEEAMAHIKRTLEGEYWETVEIPIVDVEGNVKTVLWNSANIYDPSGRDVVATIAQGHDITVRKQVEQALHRAKVDWERTFNSVPDLIAILDNKHKIVRANKAMAQALGTTPEQCIGLTCYKCVHGTDKPPNFCPHSKALLDGQEHTAEVHEDAFGGDFMVSATPLKDEHGCMIGSVHVARDITERKKAEDALKKSEERYRSYIEVTGELGWTTNADGEVVEDIPAFRNYTGQSFEEVKGWGWSKALHPDDLEKTKKIWRNAVATKSEYEVEYRLRRSDGVYRHFLARGVPVFKEDGSVREWVGICIDITKRKEMENELLDTLKASQCRQSEISALLEASKAVLIHHEFSKAARSIFDSCKNLLGAKAGYVALLSKDEKENHVLFLDSGGLPCAVDPSLAMPIRGLRAEVYITGKVVYCNDFSSSEWARLMPKGHVALKNVLFAPLTIDNKTVGIIGLANKSSIFTERDAQMASAFGEIASIALINSQMLEKLEANEKLLKAHSERLEEMVEEKTKLLRDSERLAAIGATAGMVGHDVRNPLQAIIGDIFLAKTDLASCPDSECKASVQESLSEIEKNVEYINKIVADLQDFARPLNPIVSETDLKRIIDELVNNHNIPENIQTHSQVGKDAETIVADSDYVKRILSNLVNNAIQAMPSGGTLTVQACRERNEIAITVADTGVGIPEEAKSKLFTPLFTTKSKGQGFGLAVVKRMTEASGGTVAFESQADKGTKFIVRLPKRINDK